jgi:hypothetical protein
LIDTTKELHMDTPAAMPEAPKRALPRRAISWGALSSIVMIFLGAAAVLPLAQPNTIGFPTPTGVWSNAQYNWQTTSFYTQGSGDLPMGVEVRIISEQAPDSATLDANSRYYNYTYNYYIYTVETVNGGRRYELEAYTLSNYQPPRYATSPANWRRGTQLFVLVAAGDIPIYEAVTVQNIRRLRNGTYEVTIRDKDGNTAIVTDADLTEY